MTVVAVAPGLARLAPGVLAGMAACAPVAAPVTAPLPPERGTGALPAAEGYAPEYLGVETRLLDPELVNLRVAMRGARDLRDVEAYARCAAAGYTLVRGYGFARHLRTDVAEEGGVWWADAVYTISPALPGGLRRIDAEVVAAACLEEGIPTV